MNGYSDRLQHALAFAAKHAPPVGARGRLTPEVPGLAGTGVALLLARHGAGESVVIAALLRPVTFRRGAGAPAPVGNKFGADVARILQTMDPVPLGWPVGWGGPEARERALSLAAGGDEAVLDLLLGEAVLACGTWAATARRLGPEYVASAVPLRRGEALEWFVRLAGAVERRPAANRTALCGDLRRLGAELVRSVPAE